MSPDDIPNTAWKAIGCPECGKPMLRISAGWLCPIPGHSRVVSDNIMADRVYRHGGVPIADRDKFQVWFGRFTRLAKRGFKPTPAEIRRADQGG